MFADQGGPNKGGTTHPSGLQGPCADLPRLCILCTHRGAAWGLFPGHPLKVAKFSLPCGSPGRRVPMDASQGTRASRGCPQRVPTRGLLLLLTLPLDVFGSFYEHIIPLFLLCKTQAFLSPHMPLNGIASTSLNFGQSLPCSTENQKALDAKRFSLKVGANSFGSKALPEQR